MHAEGEDHVLREAHHVPSIMHRSECRRAWLKTSWCVAGAPMITILPFRAGDAEPVCMYTR